MPLLMKGSVRYRAAFETPDVRGKGIVKQNSQARLLKS